MADELDDFLNKFDDKLQNKDKTDRELRRKKGEFNTAFKEKIYSVVHKTMMNILEKLRRHGHFGKMMREKFPINYYYECYTIHPKETRKHSLISVVGNSDMFKVFVITEYLNLITHNKSELLKKTEEQYELDEITPELVQAHVLKVMNEIYALK